MSKLVLIFAETHKYTCVCTASAAGEVRGGSFRLPADADALDDLDPVSRPRVSSLGSRPNSYSAIEISEQPDAAKSASLDSVDVTMIGDLRVHVLRQQRRTNSDESRLHNVPSLEECTKKKKKGFGFFRKSQALVGSEKPEGSSAGEQC